MVTTLAGHPFIHAVAVPDRLPSAGPEAETLTHHRLFGC